MKNTPKPTMLMILDGYGLGQDSHSNAIFKADKPNIDKLFSLYPHTQLYASGLSVGLPDGQMGNSEVGHLNIGAGRVVYQEFTRISKSIKDGDFFENPSLNKAMTSSISNNSALHLLGLVSDGGVHSHMEHLFALIDMAKQKGVTRLYLHCFLDGRDVPPQSAIKYIKQVESHMLKVGLGKIATISGRYFAMDRDKRWERVIRAYDAMTLGLGETAISGACAIENSYSAKKNDEFVLPTVIGSMADQIINDGDSMIMFNFRPDRAREITRAFVAPDFDGFERKKVLKNLCYVCMTQYDAEMPNVMVAFQPQSLNNTLGEYLAKQNLKQLRIAETEKYAHVTFFFNGGVEAPNKDEDRILVPSPKVDTYDMQPEMSAYRLTDEMLLNLTNNQYDVIILNFANADMVGHTGNIIATVSAIEALDICVGKIVEKILSSGGQILLTADHGNADSMLNEKGEIVTSHSLNSVPLIHIAKNPHQLKSGGSLADIAPTLLSLMDLPIPVEMTGESLCFCN